MVCHPYIVAEVACGTPPGRKAVIRLLTELESIPVVTQDELLLMLDTRQLDGRGCGFVDLSLLAAACVSEKTLIWTLDKRFELLAIEAHLAFSPRQPAWYAI